MIYIIGAGLTGLTIAHRLAQDNQVLVLEANSEPGGLCRDMELGTGDRVTFGPHIWYNKTKEHKDFISKYLDIKYMDYYVKLSIDGKIKPASLFDFPCSVDNIKRIGSVMPTFMVDADNAAANFINSVGTKAYEAFFRGYNIKQWGVDPKDMTGEWLTKRPITLRKDNKKMFGDLEAGFPKGGYTPLFESLSEGVGVRYDTKVKCAVFRSGNINSLVLENGDEILVDKKDLVINTGPIDRLMGQELEWRDVVKVFAKVDKTPDITTYSTTFPNNYRFTRMCNYSKQAGTVLGEGEVLSFAFPYRHGQSPLVGQPIIDAKEFIEKELEKSAESYHGIAEEYVYPVPTAKQYNKAERLFDWASEVGNLLTIGRQGLYAYISMSNAVEKALMLCDRLGSLDTKEARRAFYNEVRGDLW
jgi:UDP-galactopyranose mutase